MGNLLIVESPTKVKHLREFLPGWDIDASIGHIRDLPEHAFGVDRDSLAITYEVSKNKKDVVARLRSKAKAADLVYLGTDPDREGEAIAEGLKEELHLKSGSYRRVTWNEITEAAVKKGINEARDIDKNLVEAQEARRVLDRLTGYLVSGPLTQACRSDRSLSAGRVQSPVLRLVVEREAEIRNFKPIAHFGATLSFENGWTAEWDTKPWVPEDNPYVLDKDLAEAAAGARNLRVVEAADKKAHAAPPPFFTTSTMQQAASASLHMRVAATTEAAQALFENGYITYIRTDNPNCSPEFFAETAKWLKKQNMPVVEKCRSWKAKGNAQEAHEAIRPTDPGRKDIDGTVNEKALYRLIRERSIAACMPDAEFDVRSAVLEADIGRDKPARYNAVGRTLRVPGWKAVTMHDAAFDAEEQEAANPVPKLSKGQDVTALSGKVSAKQTRPPARFTEASLIRKMEELGMGRPSTYKTIISVLSERKYVDVDKKGTMTPTKTGETVCRCLKPHFAFMDYGFTSKIEERLDLICEGRETYRNLVNQLWDQIDNERKAMMEEQGQVMDCPHPDCRGHVERRTRKEGGGAFWVCDTCELEGRKKFYEDDNGKPVLPVEASCPACGATISRHKSKTGKLYWFCQKCKDENRECFFDDENGKPLQKQTQPCPVEGCGGVAVRCVSQKGNAYWICKKCEAEGRSKFLNDDNGKPVAKLSAQCPVEGCKGVLSQITSKKTGKKYWICEECEKAGRDKFFEDDNGKPKPKPKLESAKCPSCGGEILRHPRKDGGFYWKCGKEDIFLDDNDGKPAETQTCPACKKQTLVSKVSRKNGNTFFACVNPKCNKAFGANSDGSIGQEFGKKK